ncbi:hypothetical protein GE09DRAFT_184668 [Coniochaeta sp. 2T2.1]|nr:hypothetical protein GE09DRAFT_184668 [Coniochaeta sp. 2T2.1]
MSPIKRIWDRKSASHAARSSSSKMPGVISTPVDTIDLTIDDSEEEQEPHTPRLSRQDVFPILRRVGTVSNSPAAAAVAPPVSVPSALASPHAQHQSGRKGATAATPSKPDPAAGGASVASGSRHNVSPRSTRLSQLDPHDASPLNVAGRTASASSGHMAQHVTPSRRTTKEEAQFDVDMIATRLKSFAAEIDKTNARLIQYTVRSVIKNPRKRRHVAAFDDFADMGPIAQEPATASEGALRIQLKLHFASDKAPRKKNAWFPQTVLNNVKPAVPKYRFHHVEISKNIITPNTQLRFIPFLRDLDVTEEAKYYTWIDQLKEQDQSAGMEPLALDSDLKKQAMAGKEFAATLHAYLEYWIKKLGLESLNRSALIHYMASETPDDDTAITPQQKSTLLDSEAVSTGTADSHAAAKAFTEAFNRTFGKQATLRHVLMLDDVVEHLLTSKKGKDTNVPPNLRDEELLRDLENELATYSLFNCLICFSHDCEHGFLDEDTNMSNRFSISTNNAKLAPLVRRRWTEQTKQNPHQEASSGPATPCKNECFQGPHPNAPAPPAWKDKEVKLLSAMFATLGRSTVRPECAVATILGRKCWDVRNKLVSLNLSLPYMAPPPEQPRAKNMPWYDRNKKMLTKDFENQTRVHDFQQIEIIEPCHHEGPCSPANKCRCAMARHLCERFCQCTADNCPYKFTGCACHATGKSCVNDKCICYTLNRECDPVLCSGCGAAERANRLNMHDDALHATGCQNVPLQRGVSKALLMGASQLEGCGYGLFTAEDIAQEEFIVEYTGEKINQDEGVRREARRGNVFDESSNTSYLFTLLDTEGIWVDAAIYGNLSRYINHAGDGDKRGANIAPKIVYVMGEYRIRFNATRDIKTGEELFFNYGDNFPNLTKKLLEDKDAEQTGRRKPGPKRKPGRPPSKTTASTSHKGKGKEVNFAPPSKRVGRPKARGNATKTAPTSSRIHHADEMDWEASEVATPGAEEDDDLEEEEAGPPSYFSPSGTRRRRPRIPPLPEDADDYDEYRPARGGGGGGGHDSADDTEAYTLARDRRRRRAAARASGRFGQAGGADGVGSDNDGKTPTTPKKGNRGGARPGAGRKPKKPVTPSAKAGGSASGTSPEEEEEEVEDSYMADDNGDDSDGAPAVERGRGTAAYSLRNRGRKRRSAGRDDGDEEEEAGQDYGDVSELRGHDGHEDDYDSDDVIDRSRRKRQKPARYRADE